MTPLPPCDHAPPPLPPPLLPPILITPLPPLPLLILRPSSSEAVRGKTDACVEDENAQANDGVVVAVAVAAVDVDVAVVNATRRIEAGTSCATVGDTMRYTAPAWKARRPAMVSCASATKLPRAAADCRAAMKCEKKNEEKNVLRAEVDGGEREKKTCLLFFFLNLDRRC